MIIFVIPAYNEEKNIGRLIDETDAFVRSKGWDYRLIVVDDGSRDETASIVRQASSRLPCFLISYTPNKGVGEAFRLGLQEALAQASKTDCIVTKEADGTSDLTILEMMLQKIETGCDVALASCYAPGGAIIGATPLRRFLSRLANALIYALFPLNNVRTYSSFYRVYRPQALRKVLDVYGNFYREKGFACVLELLVRLAKIGSKIEEVPMVLQSGRRLGKSKMNVCKTILEYLRVIGRNALIRAK